MIAAQEEVNHALVWLNCDWLKAPDCSDSDSRFLCLDSIDKDWEVEVVVDALIKV